MDNSEDTHSVIQNQNISASFDHHIGISYLCPVQHTPHAMHPTTKTHDIVSPDGQRALQVMRERWLLAVILLVALGIRLWHLTWGLPDVYEEGYPFHNAWAYWNWGQAGFQFNPHFFHYPALSFHIQFVVQVL